MSALAAGFFGKLPARGDFVRAGLPGDFVAAWDGWWQDVLPGSRRCLAGDWLQAWLEAPVWRFALPAGACGAGAAVGLWMPSVDRAGRHFPLTVALVGEGRLLDGAAGFLDAAEQAGRDALGHDLAPDQLAARVTLAAGVLEGRPDGAPDAGWWTAGGPRVPPAVLALPGLPGREAFTAMLQAPGARP